MVRLYDGAASRPGLLLRGSFLVAPIFDIREYRMFANKEPVPPRAHLIKTLPFISYARYEIYKIP
jgi:hypothetical protein